MDIVTVCKIAKEEGFMDNDEYEDEMEDMDEK